MNNKFTTYNFTIKKGSLGDFATEWWTEKDWEEYKKYIEEITADGTLGEEQEMSMTLMHIAELDDNKLPEQPLESCRMVFLDF